MVIGHQKHYLDPTPSPPNLQNHISDRAFSILNTKTQHCLKFRKSLKNRNVKEGT